MARLSIAIQGVSKMHKTEVDLVPAGRALDELSRIDGQPSDTAAPIVILDAAEPLHRADRLWSIQPPHWDVRAYVDDGLAETTRVSCAIVWPVMRRHSESLCSGGVCEESRGRTSHPFEVQTDHRLGK
ncbi:hypothetical protein ACVINW_004002 [Bradyrhizobium sp. USDA 4461]